MSALVYVRWGLYSVFSQPVKSLPVGVVVAISEFCLQSFVLLLLFFSFCFYLCACFSHQNTENVNQQQVSTIYTRYIDFKLFILHTMYWRIVQILRLHIIFGISKLSLGCSFVLNSHTLNIFVCGLTQKV